MVARAHPTQQREQKLADKKVVEKHPDPLAEQQAQLKKDDDPDDQDATHPQYGISSSELNSGGPQLKKQAEKEAADGEDNTKP